MKYSLSLFMLTCLLTGQYSFTMQKTNQPNEAPKKKQEEISRPNETTQNDIEIEQEQKREQQALDSLKSNDSNSPTPTIPKASNNINIPPLFYMDFIDARNIIDGKKDIPTKMYKPLVIESEKIAIINPSGEPVSNLVKGFVILGSGFAGFVTGLYISNWVNFLTNEKAKKVTVIGCTVAGASLGYNIASRMYTPRPVGMDMKVWRLIQEVEKEAKATETSS